MIIMIINNNYFIMRQNMKSSSLFYFGLKELAKLTPINQLRLKLILNLQNVT